MIRPFKDLKEFKENTGLDVGSIVTLWYINNNDHLIKSMITSIDTCARTVTFGSKVLSLSDLCTCYEYSKNNKWCSFGVEETNNRPAKFKVGKEYFYFNDDDWAVHVFVNAKYRDPADNKVKIVFENTNPREVYTDENGNEYITLYENAINAENAVKYEVNAEDEVEE